jgi:replicative superfamily II helicase
MRISEENQFLQQHLKHFMKDNTKKLVQNFLVENDLCKSCNRIYLKNEYDKSISFKNPISLSSEINALKQTKNASPVHEKKIKHVLDVNLELQKNSLRDKSPIGNQKQNGISVYKNFNQTIRLFE